MPSRQARSAAAKVDWADEFPPDIDSIVTECTFEPYIDPRLVTYPSTGLDRLGGEIINYGGGDFITDHEILHRTPLHISFVLGDDDVESLFGDVLDEADLSWREFNRPFKSTFSELREEFKHTPYEPSAEVHKRAQDPDSNLFIVYCNAAREFAELDLMTLKEAKVYLLEKHGFLAKDIGTLLGIDTETVKSLISRADEKIARADTAASTHDTITADMTRCPEALARRAGRVYHSPEESEYYAVVAGGDILGGGYVLVDENGETDVCVSLNLEPFEHVPVEDLPDDVAFPADVEFPFVDDPDIPREGR